MIKGEKIILRPIVRSDLSLLNTWKNDEETFKNLGGGFLPISIDVQANWMDSLMDTMGNSKRFICCDLESEPIGMVGLYDISWIHRTCEIGIYIGNKKAKGKGYAKEACLLIERFAKEYLNLRKLKLYVVADNESAVNMWVSLGYLRVGELRQERYIGGDYKNLIIMEKFI